MKGKDLRKTKNMKGKDLRKTKNNWAGPKKNKRTNEKDSRREHKTKGKIEKDSGMEPPEGSIYLFMKIVVQVLIRLYKQ